MLIPIRVDPVKDIAATFELVTSSSPTAAPDPVIRLKTPSGRSTASHILAISVATCGVAEAGLRTMVFPYTSAGAIFQMGIASGKFHGVIRVTTPKGIRLVYRRMFGFTEGTTDPTGFEPSTPKYCSSATARPTSPRDSRIALPDSRVTACAYSSRFASR